MFIVDIYNDMKVNIARNSQHLYDHLNLLRSYSEAIIIKIFTIKTYGITVL